MKQSDNRCDTTGNGSAIIVFVKIPSLSAINEEIIRGYLMLSQSVAANLILATAASSV